MSIASMSGSDCLERRTDSLHILPQGVYVCIITRLTIYCIQCYSGWMMNRSGGFEIFVKTVATASDFLMQFTLELCEELSWYVYFCGRKLETSHCQLLNTYPLKIQSGQYL